MLDRQKTFDTVMAHLRAQGGPAIQNHKCAYRGKAGTRCAIGALIPDENYNESLEGKSVFRREICAAIPGADTSDLAFLVGLQQIHDWSAYDLDFLAGVEDEAKKFAENYDLTYKGPAA